MKNLEESIKEARNKMDVFGNKIEAIIKPFLNDDLSKKEILEIRYVGKFIVCLDRRINILEKRESPDFIIEYQNEKIGLEVKRFFNLEEVQNIKSKEALFEKAALEFENSNPEINVMVNFWTIKGFQFEGKEKKSLIKEINDFVIAKISGSNPLYPSSIEKADFIPHSSLSFIYNEGAYSPEDVTELTLEAAIQKKEVKFEKYKNNTELDRQWLLLVSGIGSDSFNFEDAELHKEIESQFEHIFLLEDYEARVAEIK